MENKLEVNTPKQFIIHEHEDREPAIVYAVVTAFSKDDILAYILKNWKKYIDEGDYIEWLADFYKDTPYEKISKIILLPLDQIKKEHPNLIRYIEVTLDIDEYRSPIVIEDLTTK